MKPILFNTEMVCATLEGRKTATRRVVRTGDHTVLRGGTFPGSADGAKCGVELDDHGVIVAPYRPGDILYVRETWAKCQNAESYVYKADFDGYAADVFKPLMKWRPSIHMPKEAARIFLRVTDVRVERLQDCGNMQAKDEGCVCCSQFIRIWNGTIKPADLQRYGWEANPWVWVIEFDRCEKPERGFE